MRAAFWGKSDEKDYWEFYVATDIVDRGGPGDTYTAIEESLKKLGESWVKHGQITPLGPNHPLTKAVLSVMATVNGRTFSSQVGS